jgi:hypothetical protein
VVSTVIPRLSSYKHVAVTHQLLPLQEPTVHLDLVEKMSTRQNPNVISAFEPVQADRAFVAVEELLPVLPRGSRNDLSRFRRSGCRSARRRGGWPEEFQITTLLIIIAMGFPCAAGNGNWRNEV